MSTQKNTSQNQQKKHHSKPLESNYPSSHVAKVAMRDIKSRLTDKYEGYKESYKNKRGQLTEEAKKQWKSNLEDLRKVVEKAELVFNYVAFQDMYQEKNIIEEAISSAEDRFYEEGEIKESIEEIDVEEFVEELREKKRQFAKQ